MWDMMLLGARWSVERVRQGGGGLFADTDTRHTLHLPNLQPFPGLGVGADIESLVYRLLFNYNIYMIYIYIVASGEPMPQL